MELSPEEVGEFTLLKREIYQRSQRICEKCQSQYRLEFHHLRPQSHGGKHEKSNLKLLCHHCHQREIFCQGFMVPTKPTAAAAVIGTKTF